MANLRPQGSPPPPANIQEENSRVGKFLRSKGRLGLKIGLAPPNKDLC